MDESTLGRMLRAVRMELLSKCETAEGLLKSWEESDEATQVIDAVCAKRLYMLGVHDALTDAIRACEMHIEKHELAASFHADAKAFIDAGVHKSKANEASALATTLREVLKKKGLA